MVRGSISFTKREEKTDERGLRTVHLRYPIYREFEGRVGVGRIYDPASETGFGDYEISLYTEGVVSPISLRLTPDEMEVLLSKINQAKRSRVTPDERKALSGEGCARES